MAINTIQVCDSVMDRWGVAGTEYRTKIDGATQQVDFQDLMVAVAEARATTVEGEVAPLSQRIRGRNKWLDQLGSALATITKAETSFKSDDKPDVTQAITFSEAEAAMFQLLLQKESDPTYKADTEYKLTKAQLSELSQRVKSKIDSLNNASQTDMTRLQQLVDRRDESFSTATDLMGSVSDTRANTIQNMS